MSLNFEIMIQLSPYDFNCSVIQRRIFIRVPVASPFTNSGRQSFPQRTSSDYSRSFSGCSYHLVQSFGVPASAGFLYHWLWHECSRNPLKWGLLQLYQAAAPAGTCNHVIRRSFLLPTDWWPYLKIFSCHSAYYCYEPGTEPVVWIINRMTDARTFSTHVVSGVNGCLRSWNPQQAPECKPDFPPHPYFLGGETFLVVLRVVESRLGPLARPWSWKLQDYHGVTPPRDPG